MRQWPQRPPPWARRTSPPGDCGVSTAVGTVTCSCGNRGSGRCPRLQSQRTTNTAHRLSWTSGLRGRDAVRPQRYRAALRKDRKLPQWRVLQWGLQAGHCRGHSQFSKKTFASHPCPPGGEPAKDLVIHEVPYYNRSAHKFQFLSFRFAPSQDDMLRLWPEMQRVGGGFPSTKFWPAVANLDLPGLRAGGLFWTRPFPSTEPGCYFLFAGRIHNDAAFLTRGILPALKDGVLRRSG